MTEEPVPPIFVVEGRDGSAYPDADAVLCQLETIDLLSGAFDIFDTRIP